jgi:hypothetical protein
MVLISSVPFALWDSPIDDLDAATTVPRDCTEVFDNHGDLNAAVDRSPFFASQVDFVPTADLRVGMVTPVFSTDGAMTTDWSSAEWIASYQIYGITAHSVFLQRVLKTRQTGLPPNKILVGPAALTPPGLLCTNAFGA